VAKTIWLDGAIVHPVYPKRDIKFLHDVSYPEAATLGADRAALCQSAPVYKNRHQLTPTASTMTVPNMRVSWLGRGGKDGRRESNRDTYPKGNCLSSAAWRMIRCN
jgi:hypothetical protein